MAKKYSKKYLQVLAVRVTVDGWDIHVAEEEFYGSNEPDIYNDFDDILLEDDRIEKLSEKDQVYINKFIRTEKFFKRVYKKRPEAKEKIMF
jgi:hypothetical protein